MNFFEYIQGKSTIDEIFLLNQSFNWIFWLFNLIGLFAFAYVRTAQPGYIALLFRTGLYNRQLYQNTQEQLRLNSFGSVFLLIAYLCGLTNLIMYFLPIQGPNYTLLIFGVLTGVLLVKYLVIKLTMIVSESSAGLTEHWLNHLIYFQITGLILVPFLAFTHYLPTEWRSITLKSILVVVILIVLVREYQSILRSVQQRMPFVYIILYLCTLELIPLIVFIKVLVR